MVLVHKAKCEYRGIEYRVKVHLKSESQGTVKRAVAIPHALTGYDEVESDWSAEGVEDHIRDAVGELHSRIDAYHETPDSENVRETLEELGADVESVS